MEGKNNTVKIIIGIVVLFVVGIVVILGFLFNSTKKTVENSFNNAKVQAFEAAVSSVQQYIDDQIELCGYGLGNYDNIFISGTCKLNINSDLLKYVGYEDALTNLNVDSNNVIISVEGIGTFEGLKYPVEN